MVDKSQNGSVIAKAELKNRLVVGTLMRRLETEEKRLEKLKKDGRFEAISYQAGVVGGLTAALYVARGTLYVAEEA